MAVDWFLESIQKH